MNLFRQAAELLKAKDAGSELSEEEFKLINTAIIPLMVKTDGIFPDNITISEGLEELSNMVEEEPEILRNPSIRSEPLTRRNPLHMSEPKKMRNPSKLSEPVDRRNSG